MNVQIVDWITRKTPILSQVLILIYYHVPNSIMMRVSHIGFTLYSPLLADPHIYFLKPIFHQNAKLLASGNLESPNANFLRWPCTFFCV